MVGNSAVTNGYKKGLANTQCEGNMEQLAEKINHFFQSVAAHLPGLTEDNAFLRSSASIISLSIEEVERQLSHLNATKATGPDDIPAWVLRDFSPLLAAPLCAIFNSSVIEGHV